MGILAGRWASMEEVADLVVFSRFGSSAPYQWAEIPVDGGYSVNAR